MKADSFSSRTQIWIIVSVSFFSVALLHVVVPAFDPETFCCDHLFYRAQAVSWAGLDLPQYLEPPPGNPVNDAYAGNYWDPANGLASQPPYVYRPAVPLVAGLLGHVVGIDSAFRVVNAAALFAAAVFTGLAVRTVALRLSTALLGSVLVGLHPQMISFVYQYMLVDSASLAIVALTLFLTVKRQYLAAVLVASLVAPLVRETLIPLGIGVALYALFLGKGRVLYFLVALVAPLEQVLLRALITVPSPPGTAELFDPNYGPAFGYQGVTAFITAFGFASVLGLGAIARSVRPLLLAFVPWIAFLFVITSSQLTDGLRVWTVLWPLILVLGIAGWKEWLGDTRLWWGWIIFVFTQCAVAALSYWDVIPLGWNALMLGLGSVLVALWLATPIWRTGRASLRTSSSGNHKENSIKV